MSRIKNVARDVAYQTITSASSSSTASRSSSKAGITSTTPKQVHDHRARGPSRNWSGPRSSSAHARTAPPARGGECAGTYRESNRAAGDGTVADRASAVVRPAAWQRALRWRGMLWPIIRMKVISGARHGGLAPPSAAALEVSREVGVDLATAGDLNELWGLPLHAGFLRWIDTSPPRQNSAGADGQSIGGSSRD
jgi:hypothetical protein